MFVLYIFCCCFHVDAVDAVADVVVIAVDVLVLKHVIGFTESYRRGIRIGMEILCKKKWGQLLVLLKRHAAIDLRQLLEPDARFVD